MERTNNSDDGWIIEGHLPEGLPTLTEDEAAAEEAGAMERYRERRVFSNERMQEHITAMFEGREPEPLQTEAELNVGPTL